MKQRGERMPEPVQIDLPMSAKTAKVLAWVAWVFVLIGLVSGAVAAFAWVTDIGQQVAAGISVIALLIAAELNRRLPSSKAMASGIVGLLLVGLLVGGAGCALGPYDIAVRTVRTVQQARDLTGAQLAAAMRSKRADCVEKHGAKTKGYADCVRGVLEAQDKWAKIARPVVDTSCQAAVTALRTTAFVEKCKADKDCNKRILTFVALGYCAISRGLRFFGHFFSDKGSAVLNTMSAFEGVACGQ